MRPTATRRAALLVSALATSRFAPPAIAPVSATAPAPADDDVAASEQRLLDALSLCGVAGAALSLLLVFRTNTSYSRWLEARQAWGRIVSHCRNIMRQSVLWLDDADPTAARSLQEVRLCSWVFPRSLWAHLSDPAKEPRFAQEVREAMGTPEAADALLDAPHRPLI